MTLYNYCYNYVLQPVDRWPYNIAIKRRLKDRRNRRVATLANVLEKFVDALFRNPQYSRYSSNFGLMERALKKHLGNYGPKYIISKKQPVIERTVRELFGEIYDAHRLFFEGVARSIVAMAKFLVQFQNARQFYHYVDSLSKSADGIQVLFDAVNDAVPLLDPGVVSYWLYRIGCRRFYFLPESFLNFCDNYSEGHYSCYAFSLALVNTLAKDSHVPPYRMGTVLRYIYDGVPGISYTEEDLEKRRRHFDYALAYFYLSKGKGVVPDAYPPLTGENAVGDVMEKVFAVILEEQGQEDLLKAAEAEKRQKRMEYNNRKRPEKNK